jgi:hypothetical protein
VHDVHAAATAASMLSTGLSHLLDMTFAARFDFRSIGCAKDRPSWACAVGPRPPYFSRVGLVSAVVGRRPGGRVFPRADGHLAPGARR